MPYFPRFAAQQQSPMDLGTLLSLLTDSHPHAQSPAQKESAKHSYHHQRASTFSPKFDVYETSKDYVLEGELPGLQDKKKIEIEFTDPQTLVVRGKIEKIVEEHKAPAPAPEATTATETQAIEEKPQVAEDKEVKTEEEKKPVSRPHTPPRPVTVEDSPDEDDVDYEDARKSTKLSRSSSVTSATTTATETDKQSTDSTLEDLIRTQLKKKQQLEKQKQEHLLRQKQEQQLKAQKQQQQQKPQQPQVRYWVSERTIGSFQRTFNFPGFIDQDRVSAKLENGILTVVVPKRSKAAIKRVEVL